jgi:hypothetical protein
LRTPSDPRPADRGKRGERRWLKNFSDGVGAGAFAGVAEWRAARRRDAVRLRDETRLDTLSDDLGGVRRTVQPAHASLWLRPEAGSKGEQAD